MQTIDSTVEKKNIKDINSIDYYTCKDRGNYIATQIHVNLQTEYSSIQSNTTHIKIDDNILPHKYILICK